MTAVIKDVTIDFQKPQQRVLRDWLASLPEGTPPLPPLTIRVSHNVEIDDLGEDEVEEWYEKRNPSASGNWIERCYRHIAMGENDEALDLIYREAPDGLAPPSTEKRTADRLKAPEIPAHAEN